MDELNLGWDSFKWRNHQPDIGRFFGIDPLAEEYLYNSPYAFSENKVVAHVELEGLESVTIAEAAIQREIKKVENAVMPVVNQAIQSVKNAANYVADKLLFGKYLPRDTSTPDVIDGTSI